MDEPRVMADDVRAACEGMLQLQLYAVFTKPVGGMKPVMAILEPHLEYQISMEKRGILFAAGPFWTDDEQEWRGEGSGGHSRGESGRGQSHRSGGPHARERRTLL